MGPDNNKTKFILTHFLFLLSLAVMYFIPHAARIAGDTFLPPQGRFVRFYIIGVFTIVFLTYYLFLYHYKKAGISLFRVNGLSLYFWLSTVIVFLFLCGFHAVVSSDLYEYSIRGRMFSVYGLNPYLHVPEEIKQDMFYPLIFWKSTPESYGPAWVLIGAFHALFFKNSVILTVFTYKLVLFVFFLFSGWFFYGLCKELKLNNAEILTAAFITNPLIVIMTLVDGHNEIAMVAFILASLYFLYRSKYVVSLLLLAVAVQVKFVYMMIVPLFALYILFGPGEKNMRSRVREMIIGGVLALGVIVLLWLPFGWKSVAAVFDYYRDLGGLFWPDSIPFLVYSLAGKAGLAVSKGMVGNVFSGVYLITYGCLIWYFVNRVKTDRQAIFSTTSLMILALLFTNYTPFQAWYLLWVIPFIFLSRFRTNFLLVFLLSYFLIMTFWKRMSTLAVPMMFLYFILLANYDKFKNRLSFIFSLKLPEEGA